MTDQDRLFQALVERVAQLDEAQRVALARTLSAEAAGSRPAQLVAYVSATGSPPSAADLDVFLGHRLPDYMVPSRYVLVDRMPTTPAGKVDRAGLATAPGTDLGPSHGFVPPRTEGEEQWAQIWRDVLGIDEVSVHDDFFEIGGDSLLSIRVISRAGRAGIAIRPEDFFEAPTIAQLAAAHGRAGPPAEQEPVVGRTRLTPIQEWFFERITAGRDRWNQAVLLRAPDGLNSEALAPAVAALVEHHDGLRLRFIAQGDEWHQEFGPVPDAPPLRTVDLEEVPPTAHNRQIQEEANAEHASLRLEEGNLFRVVLFQGPSGQRRVLLVVHHLLVDGVSWQVLLDDLSTLVVQSLAGSPLRLPRKTASLRSWALALRGPETLEEVGAFASHWREEASRYIARSALESADETHGAGIVGDAVLHRLTLPSDSASLPHDRTTGARAARVHERILAALALGWCRWSGESVLRLDMEGHGRDVLGRQLDVSRTVGWFTTVFPVTLRLVERTAERARGAVQECLGRLPMQGAAHGIARYLHPNREVRRTQADLPRADVLFNYLGITDGGLPPDSPFERDNGPTGDARSPVAPRAYPIEINAHTSGGRVVVDIEYAGSVHRAESIARLADEVAAAFAEVTEGTTSSEPHSNLAGLDAAGLEQVAHLLAELDED